MPAHSKDLGLCRETKAELRHELERRQRARSESAHGVQRTIMYALGVCQRWEKSKHAHSLIDWQREMDRLNIATEIHKANCISESLRRGMQANQRTPSSLLMAEMLRKEQMELDRKCPVEDAKYRGAVEAVCAIDTYMQDSSYDDAARELVKADVAAAQQKLQDLRLDPDVASLADTNISCEEEIGEYLPDLEGYDSDCAHLCEQFCGVGQTRVVCPKNTPQRAEDPAQAPIKIEAEIIESSDSDTESDAE